jgi:hypothetical protein
MTDSLVQYVAFLRKLCQDRLKFSPDESLVAPNVHAIPQIPTAFAQQNAKGNANQSNPR